MEPKKTSPQAGMPAFDPSQNKRETSAGPVLPTQGIPGEMAAAPTGAKPKNRRKKALWLLGLVFFLLFVLLMVPAGRLPGMSRLVGWMGFDASDAQLLSVGRALFTWAGAGFSASRVTTRNRGKELSVFDRSNRFGYGELENSSGLFDIAAVNAARRARGLRGDGLSGAYEGPEDAEARGAVNRRVNDWSAEARRAAEQARKEDEVFFGEDGDIKARADAENQATKGSANTSSLVSKTSSGIVGAVGTDWLSLAIDKARELGIEDLEAELKKANSINAPLSSLNGSLTGDSKAKQDLARIWLLSKVANKAQQLMLKKQLAGAGYMAIEMPKKVFDSAGLGSGIMMNGNEVMADFQQTNKLLLDEETCRKMAQEVAENFTNFIQSAGQVIDTLVTSAPTDCNTNAARIQMASLNQNCTQRQEYLGNLQGSCDRNYRPSSQSCQAEQTSVWTQVAEYDELCTVKQTAEAELLAAQQAEAAAKAALDAASPEDPNYGQLQQNYANAQQNTVQKNTNLTKATNNVNDKEKAIKDNWTDTIQSSFVNGDNGFFPQEDTDSILHGW